MAASHSKRSAKAFRLSGHSRGDTFEHIAFSQISPDLDPLRFSGTMQCAVRVGNEETGEFSEEEWDLSSGSLLTRDVSASQMIWTTFS